MEQPERSPECSPVEHILDELCCAITSMDNLTQNLGMLHQALLVKWAEIPAEHLQRLIAIMPQRLAAIITIRCENSQYRPSIHKIITSGSIKQKSLFQQIYHNYHPMTLRYAHTANFPISMNIITHLSK